MMCIFSYVGSWHSKCKLFAITFQFSQDKRCSREARLWNKGSLGVAVLLNKSSLVFWTRMEAAVWGGGSSFLLREENKKQTVPQLFLEYAPWHEEICISYTKTGCRSGEGVGIRRLSRSQGWRQWLWAPAGRAGLTAVGWAEATMCWALPVSFLPIILLLLLGRTMYKSESMVPGSETCMLTLRELGRKQVSVSLQSPRMSYSISFIRYQIFRKWWIWHWIQGGPQFQTWNLSTLLAKTNGWGSEHRRYSTCLLNNGMYTYMLGLGVSQWKSVCLVPASPRFQVWHHIFGKTILSWDIRSILMGSSGHLP